MNRVRRIFSTLKRNWQRTHAVAAPFGSALATLLLSARSEQWAWLFWQSEVTWNLVADNAGVGAMTYGMLAVTAEGGASLIFWALDERDKRRERRAAEREQELATALAKARDEGLSEGRSKGLSEGRSEGRAETDAEWREWYHRQVERGVELEEPPTRDGKGSDPASGPGK